MMNAALGAGDLERRVEHERQHVLQHAAGAERPEALEEGRDLPQVVPRAGRGSAERLRESSADRKMRSAPPPRPRRTLSPLRSSHSVTSSPFTNVP